MTILRLGAFVVLFGTTLQAQSAGKVSGIVLDAKGGQALSKVDIVIAGTGYRTHSKTDGHFEITGIAPGDYTLQASTVGYWVLKTDLHVHEGEARELQLLLNADTLRPSDTVLVGAGPLFDSAADAPSQFSIRDNDVRNLATVLSGDPMRAVQGVPGVTSNDDFEARFSLQGAGFNRVGVYLDGILLHQPVHTLEQTDASGSASILNPNLVDQLDLHQGPFSERFADSSAGALDVRMRDGNSTKYAFRGEASFANVGLMAEGPLRFGQCSWIAGIRKSYLQYILDHTLSDPSMAFGVQDNEGRLSCNVTKGNTIVVEAIDSHTGSDRTSVQEQLGINSVMLARQDFDFGNLAWHYTPNDRLLVTNRLAWMGDNFTNQNPYRQSLGDGQYREFAWNSEVRWMWNTHDPLAAGFTLRDMRDNGFSHSFLVGPNITILNRYGGSGTLAGGFLEQSWSIWDGHIRLNGGGRWDDHSVNGISAFSPQTSATFLLWPTTRIELGWAQHVQYPEIAQLTSNLGSQNLLPMRSTQEVIAIEQRVTQRTRLRAEVYNRHDRDLLYQPWLDPRLIGGSVFLPPTNPLYTNSLRGRSRSIQIFLQRMSANGVSGWISYTHGRTVMHDGVTGDSFPSDWDQTHTVNAYTTYRLRPTINLSAHWTYGSGFPMPGYLQANGPFNGLYEYLSEERNRLRLGSYQRVDLRITKSWTHEHWRTTLFAEVMNLTNKVNERFASFDGVGGGGTAWITLNQTFPILPSAGITFER
jgi:hypothetical protein